MITKTDVNNILAEKERRGEERKGEERRGKGLVDMDKKLLAG